MRIAELLKLQWQEYPSNHQSRLNLLIHLVTTPWFMLGSLMLPMALLSWSFIYLLVGLGLMGLVIALQGVGHSQEQIKPRAFAGVSDFIWRILLEQWVTFPRYILSGLWKHRQKRQ